jgi:RNA polymerase sigma-70 factor, ECF subfamily
METDELALSMAGCASERDRPVQSDATHDVLRRALAGDRAAFDLIVVEHHRRVLRTTLHLLGRMEDAEDAAQEVFLRLLRYKNRIDSRRDLAPWLYRLAVNVCHDFRRERQRRTSVTAEQACLSTINPKQEAALLRDEQKRIVAMALETLTERERAAIVLRDIEGLSTREVARILGSREVTVRSEISRGRVRVKKFVDLFTRGRV